MILKKYLNNIKINEITILIVFLCLLTGMIKEILAIFILLFFHELGHLILSYYYKWNVKSIVFYPFGGLITYDEIIDKPLKEEFLIAISGISFQTIIFFIFFLLNKSYIISNYFYSLIKNYYYGIIILNILPIVPLDGSKILNILLNKFICFKKSYILTIYISLCFLIILFCFIKTDKSYYMLLMFLIYQMIINFKNRKYLFKRFILEKKLYKNKYLKYKIINDINNMHRNKKHLFKKNSKYYTEKQILK